LTAIPRLNDHEFTASTWQQVKRSDMSAPISVTAYGAEAELPADVTAFLSEQTKDQLWLSPLWFELLLRYSSSPGQRLRIYAVRSGSDGGTVECVFYAAASAHDSRRRQRKLRSLTNFYTISFAPIVRGDSEVAGRAIGALVRALSRETPVWDVIELQNLIEETHTTAELVRAFRNEGMLVDTYPQSENWFQPTSGLSAERYFESLPSQVRNTITRKLRRATKEHIINIQVYRSPEELARGINDYQRIYARSWKDPEAHPEFIPQLLRRSAEKGMLRLGVLYVDSEPAAAQIWLVIGVKATIYKLAYDEKFARLSVGSILTKAMFDQVIDDDGVAEVDYGTGSDAYKRDWMTKRRRIIGLVAFNPRSVHGLVAAGRHFGGRWIRPLLGVRARQGRRGRVS